jgi:hypothetical protein
MDIEEMYEYFEINDHIAERMKKYRPEANVDWRNVRTE